MTRFSRRGIVRALRAPAPDPPPELGRRLKEQIPEDLFTARATPPESRRRGLRRAPWAVAASILVAAGSGYLAVWLFEDRGGVPRQQLADFDRARMTQPVAEPVAGRAPATPEPGPLLEAAAGAPDPESRASEDAMRLVAAPDSPAKIEERMAEKRRLERQMRALPGSTADREASSGVLDDHRTASRDAAEREAMPPPDAPRVTWFTERHSELLARVDRLQSDRRDAARADRSSSGPDSDGAYLEVAAQPISTLTVTVGQRSLGAAVGSAANADPGVPLGEILDAATPTRVTAPDRTIEVAGTPTRRPGLVALLLSAIVAESGSGRGAPGPAGSIELELDPDAARRYRLLASHAHLLAATASAPTARADAARAAGTSSTDATAAAHAVVPDREIAAPVYRLTAVFEIELVPGARSGAPLGTVRLRGGGADAGSAPFPALRPIGAADVAGGWDQAPVELRLAVLAAELAVLPRDAGADLMAPIAQDLERLRADPGLEPAAARLAADLAALTSRPTGAADDRAVEPAPAPARDDD